VVIAVGLAVLIRSFLVQAFFIPSGSMETTLHGCPGCSGDRVLVNKVVYDIHDPRPGDVVVFRGPPSWDAEVPVSEPGNVVARALHWVGQTVGVSQPDEKDFVKRVIAVGGQTVACCDPQGRVTVDGVPLDEPYIYLSNSDSQSQPFGPVTVPEGRLWVMGDHRDGSADSRAHLDDGTSGTVPVSDVIGKAFVIVWPPSRWNILDTPTTFHGMSLGELSVGMPMALGVVGTLPVAAFRRRRRRGSGD
jgi:signal peptidase I, bacterial type